MRLDMEFGIGAGSACGRAMSIRVCMAAGSPSGVSSRPQAALLPDMQPCSGAHQRCLPLHREGTRLSNVPATSRPTMALKPVPMEKG